MDLTTATSEWQGTKWALSRGLAFPAPGGPSVWGVVLLVRTLDFLPSWVRIVDCLYRWRSNSSSILKLSLLSTTLTPFSRPGTKSPSPPSWIIPAYLHWLHFGLSSPRYPQNSFINFSCLDPINNIPPHSRWSDPMLSTGAPARAQYTPISSSHCFLGTWRSPATWASSRLVLTVCRLLLPEGHCLSLLSHLRFENWPPLDDTDWTQTHPWNCFPPAHLFTFVSPQTDTLDSFLTLKQFMPSLLKESVVIASKIYMAHYN